jgi:hypothetical protein
MEIMGVSNTMGTNTMLLEHDNIKGRIKNKTSKRGVA